MNRRTLVFIALAVTMLYGAGFAAFSPVPGGYAAIGGVVIALIWMSVGMFGKPETEPGSGTSTMAQPEDAPQPDGPHPPYGTPPQDGR